MPRENYKLIIESNPSREERMKAFLDGKLIKRIEQDGKRIVWLKLNKYYGVSFSLDRKNEFPHPDSFHPFHDVFNYHYVLEDYDHNNEPVKYEIIN